MLRDSLAAIQVESNLCKYERRRSIRRLDAIVQAGPTIPKVGARLPRASSTRRQGLVGGHDQLIVATPGGGAGLGQCRAGPTATEGAD